MSSSWSHHPPSGHAQLGASELQQRSICLGWYLQTAAQSRGGMQCVESHIYSEALDTGDGSVRFGGFIAEQVLISVRSIAAVLHVTHEQLTWREQVCMLPVSTALLLKLPATECPMLFVWFTGAAAVCHAR